MPATTADVVKPVQQAHGAKRDRPRLGRARGRLCRWSRRSAIARYGSVEAIGGVEGAVGESCQSQGNATDRNFIARWVFTP